MTRNEDHNSMLYWYPKIEGKIPTPKTIIVQTKGASTKWVDEGAPDEFIVELKENALAIGYPLFMRTEQLSAKHEWERTCFVPSADVLARHLYELIEMQYMMLDMQMDATPRAIILREFLHLKSFFTAYRGMPVAREFRFFATNGNIDCYHPYWPHEAIELGHPNIRAWRDYLPRLEKAPPGEATEIIFTASKQFESQMSIDVCETRDRGWMLTDMATGKDSYHWKHGTKDGGSREDE